MLAHDIWLATWEIRSIEPKARLFRTDEPVKALKWGYEWAKEQRKLGLPAKWEMLQTSWSLYGKSSEFETETGEVLDVDLGQPLPSSERMIKLALDRARMMLGLLATNLPYGVCTKFQTGISWTDWVVTEGAEPMPLESRWWGSAMKSDPLIVLEELGSTLRNILEDGKRAADMEHYDHCGTRCVEWLEIDKLSVRFECGLCKPGTKIETDATIALIGKQTIRKQTKRRRRKASKRARKAKARKTRRKAKKSGR